MEKKRVSVQIEGRNYAVVTTEEKSYVLGVADEVTESIRHAAQTGRNLDTRDCAVLAALDFCDDRHKAERRNTELVEKADQIIRQSAELAKQCKEYKTKLAAAINENTNLTKRIRALEEQLRLLLRENESLKKNTDSRQLENEKKFEKAVRDKKAEKLMGYVPMRQYSLFEDAAPADKTDSADAAGMNSTNQTNNTHNTHNTHNTNNTNNTNYSNFTANHNTNTNNKNKSRKNGKN